jgi:hypothetical protein
LATSNVQHHHRSSFVHHMPSYTNIQISSSRKLSSYTNITPYISRFYFQISTLCHRIYDRHYYDLANLNMDEWGSGRVHRSNGKPWRASKGGNEFMERQEGTEISFTTSTSRSSTSSGGNAGRAGGLDGSG